MPSGSRVIVRTAGGRWQEPASAGFIGEAAMQEMLASEPSLLPGVTSDAFAVQEFATGAGPSDVVVVDADGSIVVVECKLSGNEEIRRKVVGQVFDYASRLWRMTAEDFDRRWVQRSGSSILERLALPAIESFRENLRDGRFTLVLAVDRINTDLKRIVEYLNVHTDSTVRVLAIELERAEHQGVEILIPTVYGSEIADAKGSAVPPGSQWTQRWTPEDVVAAVAGTDAGLAEVLTTFTDSLVAVGLGVQGTGGQLPSMIVGTKARHGTLWPFAVYTGENRHTLSINFQWLRGADPDAREPFLAAVAAVVPGVDAAGIRAADYAKRPGFDLAVLARPGVLEALVAATQVLMESVEL